LPIPAERQTEGSPREFAAIAKRLAGDAATPLEALERIAHHLQTELRYDLQAPEAMAGVDPVLYFLRDSRRGFCVHFASALALLGREIGVPTRLVGGYAGGHQAGDVTVFDERHAHAWVEAYVDGRWITLDPTPGGAFLPGFSSDHGRIVLALTLLGGVGLALWRRRREPEIVSRYRRMLGRLRKAGIPVTEATTPREALDLAREGLDAGAWEEFRELVERYEAARFGGSGA
jgi:MYXO-CTERM domain-containing protein